MIATGISWDKLRWSEVQLAGEKKDPGAVGLEPRQSADALFQALSDGVDTFGSGVRDRVHQVVHESTEDAEG